MAPGNEKITGKVLCRLRMAKGIAQKQVAERLKMTQQAYSKIEKNGAIKPFMLDSILIAMKSNREELKMIQQLMESSINRDSRN